MGFSVLMITMDPAKIGQMSCNPAVGGQPKVRSSARSTPWAAKWGWYKNEGAAPGAAFMDFVRVIAEAIAKDYPQVTVLAEAYQWSRKPLAAWCSQRTWG